MTVTVLLDSRRKEGDEGKEEGRGE